MAGLWPPGGSPPVLLPPNIFYKIQNKSSLIFTAFGVAQNRYLKLAPFSGQNSSCRHSPSSCKPCKIREKRHKYCTVKCNNNPKSDKYQHESMMQNGRIRATHPGENLIVPWVVYQPLVGWRSQLNRDISAKEKKQCKRKKRGEEVGRKEGTPPSKSNWRRIPPPPHFGRRLGGSLEPQG